MTRARETLTLCQGVRRGNPFSPALDGAGVTRCPLPAPLPDLTGLARKYRTLGFADVDLGFAGRKPADDPLHSHLDRIAVGQPLELVRVAHGWGLRVPGETLVLGRLAGKYSLPATDRVEASVESVVRRHRDQSRPEFASQLKCEHWYVLLPTLTWCEAPAEDIHS